jgi:hypothetical protein
VVPALIADNRVLYVIGEFYYIKYTSLDVKEFVDERELDPIMIEKQYLAHPQPIIKLNVKMRTSTKLL